MRRDLEKRLDALERVRVDPLTIWLPEPEGGLAGWEILPGDGRSIRVWRHEGEDDDQLEQRTTQKLKAALRESGGGCGLVTIFGMDDSGVTR